MSTVKTFLVSESEYKELRYGWSADTDKPDYNNLLYVDIPAPHNLFFEKGQRVPSGRVELIRVCAPTKTSKHWRVEIHFFWSPRQFYKEQVALLNAQPDVPEHLKRMFQNIAGFMLHMGDMCDQTTAAIENDTLSQFTDLDGEVRVVKREEE